MALLAHGQTGLSPPTRGSPPGGSALASPRGSIPAHTGKPERTSERASERAVYPRPHGEAVEAELATATDHGLSPPTRGSLRVLEVLGQVPRSIPAHTGKPSPARGGVGWRQVYPRPHGEACWRWQVADYPDGLSPPTRGSLRVRHAGPSHRGSIPAHTGKP